MSFLLDALRKSEKRQRLGDVPNIHSTTELESRASRNPGRKPVLLLLLAAFLVFIWFAWRHYAPPEEAFVDQHSPQLETGINAENTHSTDSSRRLPEIPQLPSTDNASKPDRTAVERYSGPSITESGSRQKPTNDNYEPLVAGGPLVLSESQTPTTTATTVPGAAENMDDSSWMVSGNVQDQEENDGRTFEPGLIGYWQLPESVRQQLPNFRISVIVFAKRPQDRFILLNGQRLIEGDEPQPDLVLEEIRSEGAVFSYRLYQFLVTQ